MELRVRHNNTILWYSWVSMDVCLVLVGFLLVAREKGIGLTQEKQKNEEGEVVC